MGLAGRAQVLTVGALLVGLAMAGCGSGGGNGHRDTGAPVSRPSKEANTKERSRDHINGEEGKSVLEGRSRACAAVEPVDPAEAEALLPKGIHLPDGATFLALEQDDTHVTITAFLKGTTPTKLKMRYLTEVPAAGYKVERQDDEGFEAEVSFTIAAGRPGTLQFVKSACPPGSVRVVVSYLKATSTTSAP